MTSIIGSIRTNIGTSNSSRSVIQRLRTMSKMISEHSGKPNDPNAALKIVQQSFESVTASHKELKDLVTKITEQQVVLQTSTTEPVNQTKTYHEASHSTIRNLRSVVCDLQPSRRPRTQHTSILYKSEGLHPRQCYICRVVRITVVNGKP